MNNALYSYYKTELCKLWESGSCSWGDKCAFAHGKKELLQKPDISFYYKTKKCKSFWNAGYCKYGQRCCFIHNETKLKNMWRSYYTLLLKIRLLREN